MTFIECLIGLFVCCLALCGFQMLGDKVKDNWVVEFVALYCSMVSAAIGVGFTILLAVKLIQILF